MISYPKHIQQKKNAFVLLSTDLGTMIVNRFDRHKLKKGGYTGVSNNLLDSSSYDDTEMDYMVRLLTVLHQTRGDGVVMLDGGANIGAHALIAGRLMQGWGTVIAVEAQERIFYSLAGNIAINNLFNVSAIWAALDKQEGTMNIPLPNYFTESSFGSLELIQDKDSEDIGQLLINTQEVTVKTIDSLNLPRLDFLKLDVEGMEEQALLGGINTIDRDKPIILLEHFKSNITTLDMTLDLFGYEYHRIDHANTIAIHKTDSIRFD